MQQKHKAIGLLGGTFDPIHFGHLRLALELQETLDLSRIHILPTRQPMYRKQPVATPEQRLAMVECAITSEPVLVNDDREIKRLGPTYTIDTLLEMRNEFGETPLCLLVGIDAFLGFTSWYRWAEILENAHLIVAHRPHFHLPKTGMIADLLAKRLQKEIHFIHEHRAGGIILKPITALEISATDIRKQIAMGRNPRYLLPDSVYDYIKQHQIYSIT
jgi:nicotinate-nucleotide adenylyltransferase